MAQEPGTRAAEARMEAGSLYREEIYTDRAAGTIRGNLIRHRLRQSAKNAVYNAIARDAPSTARCGITCVEHGPFRRTVQLGAEVAADAAKATYHDGILRVELPLQQPEARTRSVPVEIENR